MVFKCCRLDEAKWSFVWEFLGLWPELKFYQWPFSLQKQNLFSCCLCERVDLLGQKRTRVNEQPK